MCTGRSARVRSLTAAAAAAGSRARVTGSVSANTGRARSYRTTLAEATNERGLVITSSPSLTPTARSARWRPAVPLETAHPNGAPTRAANALSNAGTRGPSESWPERSTSTTARSSASPRTGRASGTGSALTYRSSPPHRASPVRGDGHLAGLHAVLQRIDERIPGGGDHVLGDPDRAPHLLAVGGIDQDAGDRAGALRLIEDAHLEVDQLDVAQMRVDLTDRVTQRGVEGVHRAVALGRAHVALATEPDLDRGLGRDLAVGALLDEHAPGLEAEEGLIGAGLLAHKQLEGPVGGLELKALVLELLDALDDALGELLGRLAVSGLDPRFGGLLGDRALAREL